LHVLIRRLLAPLLPLVHGHFGGSHSGRGRLHRILRELLLDLTLHLLRVEEALEEAVAHLKTHLEKLLLLLEPLPLRLDLLVKLSELRFHLLVVSGERLAF
jgi:hypothetical protein